MNILNSIILGVVQGLTEFLPVSSSGHLVIFQKILGISPNLSFMVAVHLATLLAVIIYFRKDILEILKLKNLKLAGFIILGTLPTVAIGLSLKDLFERMFDSLLVVGGFLILTGILILMAEWVGSGRRNLERMKWWDALIIGAAQGCAVAPGLSRMGATVSASLILGLERKLAARFSFLLSILVILGAGIFKAKDLISMGTTTTGLWSLIFGGLAALISGYLSIKIFMGIIQRTNIRGFAYYCLVIGVGLIIWSLR